MAKTPLNFRVGTVGNVVLAQKRLGLAMQDLVMLLFTSVFFVLAFLYVKACQKLR